MTYCAAAVEQAILCHLFFSLTKNILATAFLGLLILVHMGLAFTSGALILVLDSEMTAALSTAAASAVMCAAVDIFIAIALGSRFWKLPSPTPSRNSAASRFLLLFISAGLIVASNTLIMMALLLKHSAALSFFLSCQGRVYTVTLLTNFLVGIYFRRDSSANMTTTTPSLRGQHTSRITGVEFDVVDGYDTEIPSSNAQRSEVMESKSPPATSSEAVPYNYNLDTEYMQLERRSLPYVGSIP
ncbi:hypothetical protein B0H19DRAFT_183234 [Mycena capillaripes]|nr:hypothetical protein B0H19DRAFT_183234 [Mycena capillaripes]